MGMTNHTPQKIAEAAVGLAMALGADIAGIAAWADVMAGPSRQIQPCLRAYSGVGAVGGSSKEDKPRPGSLLVVGVAHPAARPELDYWQEHLDRRTLGNDILARITGGAAQGIAAEHGVRAWDLAYHPGRGGVFLKDAAVLAGLGCVGKGNLFIAPEYGPRLRLRAMALEVALPSSGVMDFDPCQDCDAPCRKACPQEAMSSPWLAGIEGPSHLPARDGSYDRLLCNRQMEADIAAGVAIALPGEGRTSKQVHYCRRCELACVAGRASQRRA